MKIAVLLAAFLVWPLVNSIKGMDSNPTYNSLVQTHILFCVLLFLHLALYSYRADFKHILDRIFYDQLQPFIGLILTIPSFYFLSYFVSLCFNASENELSWDVKILVVLLGFHQLATALISVYSLWEQLMKSDRFHTLKPFLYVLILVITATIVAIRQRTLIMREETLAECSSVLEYWRYMNYRMMLLIPALLGWGCTANNFETAWKKLQVFVYITSSILILGNMILGLWYINYRSTALSQGQFALCNEHLLTCASFFIFDSLFDIPGVLIVALISIYGTCCIGFIAIVGIVSIINLICPSIAQSQNKAKLLVQEEQETYDEGEDCQDYEGENCQNDEANIELQQKEQIEDGDENLERVTVEN